MVIPFLSLYLNKELAMTKPMIGWVLFFFGLGSAVGSWLGGKLTDMFGYFRVIFWSLLGVGVIFIALLFAKTFWSFSIMVFLASTVGDAFRPANYTAIEAYSKAENYTRSIGLVRLAINIGFGGGMFFGGVIAAYYGYTWLFIIDGITCIAAAFMFYFFLDNRKVKAKVKKEEKPSKYNFKSPYHDRDFMLFSLGMVFMALAFMQLFYTLQLFLNDVYLWNEDWIGYLMSGNGVLIFLIEMPMIYVLEKYSKMKLMRWGFLILGVGFWLLNMPIITVIVPVVAMLFWTIGEIISFPFTNTWAMERTTPENRGAYMGVYTLAFAVGHMFAPLLGFWLIEQFGYTTFWWIIGGFAMISYLICGLVSNGNDAEELVDILDAPIVELEKPSDF